MKIEITKAQIEAIKEMANDMSAMIGCGEFDKEWKHNIILIDKILKNNNLPQRKFK